jgi:hypothetical protein
MVIIEEETDTADTTFIREWKENFYEKNTENFVKYIQALVAVMDSNFAEALKRFDEIFDRGLINDAQKKGLTEVLTSTSFKKDKIIEIYTRLCEDKKSYKLFEEDEAKLDEILTEFHKNLTLFFGVSQDRAAYFDNYTDIFLPFLNQFITS